MVILKADRDLFFQRFKRKVTWRVEDEEQVKKIFHSKDSHTLSKMFKMECQEGGCLHTRRFISVHEHKIRLCFNKYIYVRVEGILLMIDRDKHMWKVQGTGVQG
ncbi:hypothetical protein PHAVU_009G177700 [Phaseolus vulgaris]|uniref:Uncharacterized protein n=1 Tax=Phaseolus vulgaris TaxID=3885 RepID=V7AXN8_PHAVU|nr:hypothetical protein PHAVU_009G177700g [Phaseolus vulgaris]ESW10060.1 hypothetical protein PHAVU_009G177700g [Phaseolus vulgaris]